MGLAFRVLGSQLLQEVLYKRPDDLIVTGSLFPGTPGIQGIILGFVGSLPPINPKPYGKHREHLEKLMYHIGLERSGSRLCRSAMACKNHRLNSFRGLYKALKGGVL